MRRRRRRAIQTLVIEGDRVRAMYSETAPINTRTLGPIVQAKKVSDVRFNSAKQRWEAVDRRTKRVVAHDPSRAGCVQKEHAYYERGIRRGRYPWEP